MTKPCDNCKQPAAYVITLGPWMASEAFIVALCDQCLAAGMAGRDAEQWAAMQGGVE